MPTMRKAVFLSWIVWTVVESSGMVVRAGRPVTEKTWTMGLPTDTKAECEAAMAVVVRHLQEGAAQGTQPGVTVQDLPNGVRLQGQRTNVKRRAECWPAGADPRGTR
jgi:hypothetical protein